jgi:hypothetical protein
MSEKGHDAEAEYFARIDRENKEKLAEQVASERAQEETERLRALHAQRCGKCGGELAPELFRGVEIDVCAGCGAVLLDPGELQELAGKDQTGVVSSLAAFFGGRPR